MNGKNYKCKCGTWTKNSSGQYSCSSGDYDYQCIYDEYKTDIGMIYCYCGSIYKTSTGKYACETGALIISNDQATRKYNEKLTSTKVSQDSKGANVESLYIDFEAETEITALINSDNIIILLGFSNVNMRKVEVTKPVSSSNFTSNATKNNFTNQSVKLMFRVDFSRNLPVTKDNVLRGMSKQIETNSTSIYKVDFEIIESIALERLMSELSAYKANLKSNLNA